MVASWLLSLAIVLAQGPDLGSAGIDKGDPDAPLLVIEFVDFGCGACAVFAEGTFPTVDEQLIQTGHIRWKTIPFRLGPFRHSKQATMASLCAADQDGFWPFHTWLFTYRETWQDPKDPFQVFQAYAGENGLDTLQFRVCYERDDTEDRAKDLRNLARKHGVRATPTFFIGERRVLGAHPPDTFVALVNEALQP
jgi:protein-disulfide isomerase